MASKRPLFLILNKLYKFNNYFKNGEILLNLLIMGSTGMVGNEVRFVKFMTEELNKTLLIFHYLIYLLLLDLFFF